MFISILYMFLAAMCPSSGELIVSLEQNTQVHQHNTQRKLDLHVKMQNTEVYKKSVINMGTKVYNNLPRFLKEIDDYRAFKRKLKKFLLLQSFYSTEEFVSA
jgi:hypothetical protein